MRWRKERPFDRTEVLASADRARSRGWRKRAIAGYRRVLEVHPEDLAVHAKLAPLLASAGDRAGAVASFRAASDGQLRVGYPDRALSLLVQAAEFFPDEEPLWPEIARLHLLRGRRADAVTALTRGGWQLLLARKLAIAERVLGLALQIEPYHADATAILARTLARARRKPEAVALLDDLASRVRGRRLAAVRLLAFRIAPGPGSGWRWLRAALRAWTPGKAR
jgi:Tfp pilus assembly protein PilF